jgi:hypothetical protein
LTQGKAVLELLANTVSARSQPEMALNYLTKAVHSATCLKGTRGEASKMVEWLSRVDQDGKSWRSGSLR